MQNARENLSRFNRIIKESNDVYREAAKAVGLPDCAFWLLYALRECGEGMTQSALCDALYQPKQTVNSAIKKLENEGYLYLCPGPDKRSKLVCLTEQGERLAQNKIDSLLAAEVRALDSLSEQEQETFLTLFHRYIDALKWETMRGTEEEEKI